MVKSQTDDQIVLESLREIDEFQGCSGDCLWDFLGKTFFCVVVTKRHTHAMVNHEAKSQYARLTGFKSNKYSFLHLENYLHLNSKILKRLL